MELTESEIEKERRSNKEEVETNERRKKGRERGRNGGREAESKFVSLFLLPGPCS